MKRRGKPQPQQELNMLTDPEMLAELAAYDAAALARRAERDAAAGGRPVAHDCETAGKTLCWPCALDGPEKCLEVHIDPEVHDACVAEARRLAVLRDKAPCHDCAFLKDSHEAGQEGLIAQLARQRDAFHCHQGMPLDGRGRTPAEGDYAPDEHSRYPICAGWAAARGRYVARVRAAKALTRVRRRPRPTRRERLARFGFAAFGRRRRRVPRREVAVVDLAGLGLTLGCTTRRRRSVRAALTVVEQRRVLCRLVHVGDLRRREVDGQAEHRVERPDGTGTPWIAGSTERALDAFAIVLVRSGVRVLGDGPRPDLPPYTRPPKGPRPPRPRSKKPPRPRPKPLILKAA